MLRILIVDDEIELIKGLALGFRRKGYSIQVAENQRLALEIYGGFQPQIILSDYQMPGGGGVELFEKLKKKPNFHKVRFFLYSGFELPEKARLLSQGVSGVLCKPLSLDKLEQLITQP